MTDAESELLFGVGHDACVEDLFARQQRGPRFQYMVGPTEGSAAREQDSIAGEGFEPFVGSEVKEVAIRPAV